jgi:hypothetical protein
VWTGEYLLGNSFECAPTSGLPVRQNSRKLLYLLNKSSLWASPAAHFDSKSFIINTKKYLLRGFSGASSNRRLPARYFVQSLTVTHVNQSVGIETCGHQQAIPPKYLIPIGFSGFLQLSEIVTMTTTIDLLALSRHQSLSSTTPRYHNTDVLRKPKYSLTNPTHPRYLSVREEVQR